VPDGFDGRLTAAAAVMQVDDRAGLHLREDDQDDLIGSRFGPIARVE
jgi:hypothetical protein